ncbi:MAG: TraR/DksA family transcriptional regulator, partial [Nitrospiraceae bacterium]
VQKKLIEMRLSLIREAKAEIVQILDAGGKYNGVSDDGDLADVAIRDALQATNLTRHRTKLEAIEEALRKIDEGDYGICEDCDEDIPVGRLNAMPFAVRCIECQEKHESSSIRQKEIIMHSSFSPDEEGEE